MAPTSSTRALPQPIVRQYRLRDNFRYVNRDDYVYVVNPLTYRVRRVLNGPMEAVE